MRFFHVKSRFVAHVQNVSHGLRPSRSTEDLSVNGSLGGYALPQGDLDSEYDIAVLSHPSTGKRPRKGNKR
jgi:hypothetical protein